MSFIEKALGVVNDWLHVPIIDEVAWAAYWFTTLLFTPVLTLPPLLGMCIYDFCTGKWLEKELAAKGRAVLITGCDTGFGHDLAIELYKKGWKVYAGCRSKDGVECLSEKTGPTLLAVLMDVTNQEHIDAVVHRIESEVPEGLYAVVNNAGIGKATLVDLTSMEEYRHVMEVNFFGTVSVTKSCLELLKRSQGRVVVVTSVAGLFYGMPLMSAYSASKHATEAFTSSLRFELKAWGIKVVTVNPTFHRTLITTDAGGRLGSDFAKLPKEMQEQYSEGYVTVTKRLSDTLTTSVSRDPVNVVNSLVEAVTAADPPAQMVVGCDGKYMLIPILMLPVRVTNWILESLFMRDIVPECRRGEGTGSASYDSTVKEQ